MHTHSRRWIHSTCRDSSEGECSEQASVPGPSEHKRALASCAEKSHQWWQTAQGIAGRTWAREATYAISWPARSSSAAPKSRVVLCQRVREPRRTSRQWRLTCANASLQASGQGADQTASQKPCKLAGTGGAGRGRLPCCAALSRQPAATGPCLPLRAAAPGFDSMHCPTQQPALACWFALPEPLWAHLSVKRRCAAIFSRSGAMRVAKLCSWPPSPTCPAIEAGLAHALAEARQPGSGLALTELCGRLIAVGHPEDGNGARRQGEGQGGQLCAPQRAAAHSWPPARAVQVQQCCPVEAALASLRPQSIHASEGPPLMPACLAAAAEAAAPAGGARMQRAGCR